MYRNEKKTLLEICDTLHEIHEAMIGVESIEDRTDLCDAAQQGAIRLGESLEKEDAERYADIVHRLEEYCEHVYELSDKDEIFDEDIAELEAIVHRTKKALLDIKCRLKVAFFPYKAEMWDSLESFYLAARDDPECDAFLVPIPYFEFDQKSNQMISRYDGDRFPSNEDPIPFNAFNHKDGTVDIAYVHYPYDDHNLVTTTHPDYYSGELKKYVLKLVYVPYYVTAGGISDDQLELPVYENMDYAVFQSEYAKKSCEGRHYYDKILPFGASKFDIVINKSRNGVNMPDEWREVIGDRRTLMLNSSINDLLTSNGAVLDKLEYFFELIKKDRRIAVIWRPHPLYESTFKAMRPELLDKYNEIKARFIKDKVGVLDTTPDISDTVAIADGYIGSGASSVINLFGVTGKPIFLFNNLMREPVTRIDRRVIDLNGLEYMRGRFYLRPRCMNAIFSMDGSDISASMKYEGSIPGTVNWTGSFSGLRKAKDGKMYMTPFFAEDAACYDPVMKNVVFLGSGAHDFNIRFSSFGIPEPSRKSVFYFPAGMKYLVMEYIIDKKEWIYHQKCMMDFHNGVDKPSYIGMIFGGASYGDKLYYSLGVCNRVLMLESGTGRYEILHLGKPELTYDLHIVLKGASKEGLWMGFIGSSDICLAPWASLSDSSEWRTYKMPDGYEYVHDDTGDLYGAHASVWDYGNYMIVFPHRSPHLIKLNKTTGEMEYIAEGFFKDMDKKGIGYDLRYSSICGASCLVGKNKYAVQRMRDMHIGIINLDDGSYEEFLPEISEELFDKLVPEDAGFYKGDKYDYFRMDESRLFPLENFLDVFARDGYRNVKERQLKELETLAANLDGTCGIKTHEFLTRIIEEEDKRK